MAEEVKALPTEQPVASAESGVKETETKANALTDIIIAAIPKLGDEDRARIAKAATADVSVSTADNSVTACAAVGPDGIPVAGAVAANGGIVASGGATVEAADGTAKIAGAVAAAPPADAGSKALQSILAAGAKAPSDRGDANTPAPGTAGVAA